ncbi:DNA invertase Pin-like site-specific DNA recombinase [Pedobacter sp. CG_S7]|uniref:recombinase family protein n=1 Tax=Pedobacter sp. CG_S7 TaxID=3143930 RepID=UPI00339B9296
MKIGYARVSTTDQNLDMQLNELEKAGCEKIYREKLSGKNKERPELQNLLADLRNGDQVVVWKLDRIGRSIKDLIEIVDTFKNKGVDFISLHNQIDTSTSTGRFTFNIFAALAEFEREMIVERTKAGLQAAKIRGIKSGRKPGLSAENIKKAQRAHKLLNQNNMSMQEISEFLKVGKSTLYRYVKYIEVQQER